MARWLAVPLSITEALPHCIDVRDVDGKMSVDRRVQRQAVVHREARNRLHDVQPAIAVAEQVVGELTQV